MNKKKKKGKNKKKKQKTGKQKKETIFYVLNYFFYFSKKYRYKNEKEKQKILRLEKLWVVKNRNEIPIERTKAQIIRMQILRVRGLRASRKFITYCNSRG